MQMRPFEKWMVNSLSRLYLPWYLLPRLAALVDAPLTGRGLALGPGVGWETFALAERYPRAIITGVDCDPDQVERARGNLLRRPALSTRVSFQHGDATALSFPGDSFDFASALNVLHHVRDYPRAIREVHRVLKPGARFLVQDISQSCALPGIRRLFTRTTVFTRRELKRQLEVGGFDVEVERGQSLVFLRARRR